MFYIIHGLFFPSGQIDPGRHKYFHGAFWFEKEKSATSSGVTNDEYGYATISSVILTPTQFEFTKVYHDRPNRAIRYKFVNKEGVWIGTWQYQTLKDNLGIDGGYTNCLTIPTSEIIFREVYSKPQLHLTLPTKPWTT